MPRIQWEKVCGSERGPAAAPRDNSGSPTWTYDNENNVVKQHAIHVQRQAQELRRGVLVTRQILAWIQTARHFADSTSQVSAPQEVKVEMERAESAG